MMYNDNSKNISFLEPKKPTFYQKVCSLFACWYCYQKSCDCGYFCCDGKLCYRTSFLKKDPILDLDESSEENCHPIEI